MQALIVQMVNSRKSYAGTPEQVAMALARDVSTLRDFVDSGGVSGAENWNRRWGVVDDELTSNEAVQVTGGCQRVMIDDRSALVHAAIDRLRLLERYFTKAFRHVPHACVVAWSLTRLPMKEHKNQFGELKHRPYTRKEAAQKMWAEGMTYSREWVRRKSHELDELLVDILRRAGEFGDVREESA